MVVKKKTGKGRLDKYYHLAKEQGFRARSAFKLIQLNKKYNFLEKARVLVDLCAAPGGWLQVAAKYMPVSHLIIGIDLVPIKPIPNVITFACDITTEKCRSELKKTLKQWKVDVFLHDGAPNVGTAWLQDAYSQSELVLKSMKLACEFLNPGGWFVTKVFRSKDYNSLIWVFNQLFEKVEATKPASSRNVSAEIFVVCKGYKAPQKLDPRFFDIKFVFQEMDFVQRPLNIFKPEKHLRQRDGYEDGVTLLYKKAPVMDFINCEDPVKFLGTVNSVIFTTPEEDELKKFEDTDADVLEFLEDLKVLSKKDYKRLISWRKKVRAHLNILDPAEELQKMADDNKASEPAEADMDEDERLELELMNKTKMEIKNLKRKKRKALLKKAKLRIRMNLGMHEGGDIALDSNNAGDLFDLKALKKKKDLDTIADGLEGIDDIALSDEEQMPEMDEDVMEEDESDSSDFEEDDEKRLRQLEESLKMDHERYLQKMLSKNPKLKLNKMKKNDDGEVFQGFSDNEESADKKDSDDEDDEEDNEELNPLIKDLVPEESDSKKAAMWFNQSIFQDEEGAEEDAEEDEDSVPSNKKRSIEEVEETVATKKWDEDSSDEEVEEDSSSKRQKKSKYSGSKWSDQKNKEDGKGDFEIVKAVEFDEEDKRALLTPEGMSIAMKLLSKKGKNELVDESFNRYAFMEDEEGALPTWFVEEEQKHNRPQKPITKEGVEMYKNKMKSLNAMPIRKEVEAKARIKARTNRKIERMKARANVIVDDNDLSDKQKLESINRMMKKAQSESKKKQKPTLVVAKKGGGGSGRPKGVKGRYKIVDARLRKDTKAMKRSALKKKRK